MRRPSSDTKLFGLMLGVKDIFSAIEGPTLMGTVPSVWSGTTGGFDARVISKLRNVGSTIVGKNKTSEFAVHKETDTLNPHYPELTPGTSSAGSAAAVAAGHVPISLATQTAGSIARPSSYCGVIGFKPTFGEIPRTGVLKTTESFDTVGLISNSVRTIGSVFEEARVSDLNHPTHLKRRNDKPFTTFALAIGEDFDASNDWLRESLENISLMIASNFKWTRASLPNSFGIPELRKSHDIIYARELSYYLRDELNIEGVSDELRAYASQGRAINESEYIESKRVVSQSRIAFNENIEGMAILSLAAAGCAPLRGERDKMDANLIWTALGLPQVVMPLLECKEGHPIGLSITSGRGSDSRLLAVAEMMMGN
jgi:Asp-tRNA(Asn)/Glu-tRNA(Gln) amidotransferase A subunit family amidase